MADTMRAAIEAAVQEDVTSEGTDDTEAPDETTSTPEASDGGQPEGTTDDAGDTAEAVEGTAEDAPTEYFGLDLSGLEPEQRTSVIEELRKRDDHIGKLLRERSEDDTPAPGDENEPLPEELSDEQILQALGLDPSNNPFDENAAKIALPLVRQQAQMHGMLESLIQAQEVADIDRTWRQALSGMEKEYGTLPKEVTHDRVMEWAAENQVDNPMDAYWRIVGPGKAVLQRSIEAERARTEALQEKKRASATTRPTAVEADADAPAEAKTAKAATKEVASKLLASLGLET